MSKIKNCVTHSNACDCREEKFRLLEKQNEILREAMKRIAFGYERPADMQIAARKVLKDLE